MRAVYGINNRTMEHHLICDGIGARFNLAGKYLGSNALALNTTLPCDLFSILQQGTLCEVAVILGDNFYKKQMDMSVAQNFVSSVPVPCKATFQIKRKVGSETCVQYIYVYPSTKLQPFLSKIF